MKQADGAGGFFHVFEHVLLRIHEHWRRRSALEDEGQPVFLVLEPVRIKAPDGRFFEGVALAGRQDHHGRESAGPDGPLSVEHGHDLAIGPVRLARAIGHDHRVLCKAPLCPQEGKCQQNGPHHCMQ